jgi:DNA-binding HxlR family transcriptional regulator
MPYERKRPSLDPCPVEEVLAIIGGKWKTRILYLIALQPQTFGSLRRGLHGIKQQVLAEQLKALTADGIVHRDRTVLGKKQFSRYTLTEEGSGLIPVLCALSDWGTTRLHARGIAWDSPLPQPAVARI